MLNTEQKALITEINNANRYHTSNGDIVMSATIIERTELEQIESGEVPFDEAYFLCCTDEGEEYHINYVDIDPQTDKFYSSVPVKFETEITKLFSCIDFDLLQAQKLHLLSLPHNNDILGIINLIDAIQDTAISSGIKKEDEVFSV